MYEFEKDLQAELSAVYPDYMTVLQTAKDDLLRKDCSIVLTGNYFQKSIFQLTFNIKRLS